MLLVVLSQYHVHCGPPALILPVVASTKIRVLGCRNRVGLVRKKYRSHVRNPRKNPKKWYDIFRSFFFREVLQNS